MSESDANRRWWSLQTEGDESLRLDNDLLERLAHVLELAPTIPFLEIQTVNGSLRVQRRFDTGHDKRFDRELQTLFQDAAWMRSITLPASALTPKRVAARGAPLSGSDVATVEWRLRSEADDPARLAQMLNALSASNEAILRSTTREALFQRACEAAWTGGMFTQASIALLKPGTDDLEIVAYAGPDQLTPRSVRLSADPHRPEGSGLSGRAFRTMLPCVSNDYCNDPRLSHFHELVRNGGNKSSAAFPLIMRGQSVGVLQFFATELDAFTAPMIEVMTRVASNISFAMENFERIEAKIKADQQLAYLATHDSLTGVLNRTAFAQTLGESIALARTRGEHLALLVIDLDRFTSINDSLGNAEGDALLIEMARRLGEMSAEGRPVARLGGDEFGVILPNVGNDASIMAIAREVQGIIMRPLRLGGYDFRLTASIGVAVFPEHGKDELALMHSADIALHVAKEGGISGLSMVSERPNRRPLEQLALEAHLGRAVEHNELRVHYQPKIDLGTGRIASVEALVRWQHPDLGLIPPAQFIPLAEQSGLIVPIGAWVLRTACDQAMLWQRGGLAPIRVAVNLSPLQLKSEDLLTMIDSTLQATGLDPRLLELEITETAVMDDPEVAQERLEQISDRGIRIAMDDFGIGYSSMSLLKLFPVDTLKVDRSFIRDLVTDRDDRAIVVAIIAMAKAVGIRIVAEGVETEEQLAFLRKEGCDEVQGFLFSRPLPVEQLMAVFASVGLEPALRYDEPAPRARRTEAAEAN